MLIGGATPLRRARVGVVAAILLHVACASTSRASNLCGDDVDGRRIPCACGDTVVSDTKLCSGDPVLARACPVDGLVVRADTLAEDITLDLGGHVLRGSGTGTGIRVDAGGTDGALIVGGNPGERASVVGFTTGIVAQYADVLRRIERVTVSASRRDGIVLRTRGTLLVDVETSDNARDGVRLNGEGGHLIGIRAHRNGDTGVRVIGRGAVITGTTQDNKNHGVVAEGAGIELRDVVSRGNGGRGVMVRGPRSLVVGLVSEANLLADKLPPAGGGS